MKKEEKFIKERNEMLKKNSVAELEKFFKKWAKEIYPSFKAAPMITKKATLCKMIVALPELKDTELAKESEAWLRRAGMRLRVRPKTNDPCKDCENINTCFEKKNEPCDKMFLENDWLAK